ncbi:ATP-binding protein [Agromyces atrinae]|uniref:AAA family ATPase n=1 Tax=Agromyces atrinae TaxID=592376 RepID=UPI001F591F46|nr:AAA family ATPase [Agromyces atrinae]MCI2959083.1 ATP-binding protein [Agromyces atrinae]
MRIVVSGTHASGKSTLISDFAREHPEYAVLPDPFELVDEAHDAPGASPFAAQLGLAAERLTSDASRRHLIAERGPLDFLAYLRALEELELASLDPAVLERAEQRTLDALSTIDLLVVLPLNARDRIDVGSDEHLELRETMNDVLLDLIDDPDVVGDRLTIAELTGTPEVRLAALEELTGAG